MERRVKKRRGRERKGKASKGKESKGRRRKMGRERNGRQRKVSAQGFQFLSCHILYQKSSGVTVLHLGGPAPSPPT